MKLAERPAWPENARHVVNVSGGKDSTAVYLAALDELGPDGFAAVFADTGWEAAATYGYIASLAEMAGGPPVRTVAAPTWLGPSRTSARLIEKNTLRGLLAISCSLLGGGGGGGQVTVHTTLYVPPVSVDPRYRVASVSRRTIVVPEPGLRATVKRNQ